jgi:hypothetical protein
VLRRGAKVFVTGLAALAALGACSSEADQQRDALAKVMSVPVAKLCPVPESADNQEGGGLCTGDCRKAKDVRHARFILSAATDLEKLAPSPDPTTERELAPVRAAAHAYAAEVGPACPIDIKPRDTTMSEVEGCAAVAKSPPFTTRETDLRKALATFLTAMPKGHGFAKASRCGAGP